MRTAAILCARAALAIGLTILILGSACVAPQAAPTSTPLPTVPLKPVSAGTRSHLAAADTRFGLRLFAELARQDAGKNVFISPASVAMALAMTYNGAQGETQQAMAQALEVQGLSLDDLNQAYAELRAQLANPDPKVQLAIANSLWAREGVPFRPEFIQANRSHYGAEVTNLAFGPGTVDTINGWVKEKTNGRIERIVERLDPQSVLFLVNAIYLKAAWMLPFDANATKPGTFTRLDGSKVTLPMMRRGDYFRYYRSEGFQAVSLPYGGGRVSMYIFLPDEGSSLDAFLQGLSAESWEQWMGQFGHEQQGVIVMPRFRAEYGADLVDALTALGMGIAFDQSRADLHGMIDTAQPLWIGGVAHKATLAVTEEGTEAAAATAVEVRAGAAPGEPFQMVVDRPFFCAIRDNETGMLLFLGAIVGPEG